MPCLTTVQALAAAVQGIDALNRGEVGVRSLQEHAEHLTAARKTLTRPARASPVLTPDGLLVARPAPPADP